MASSVAVSTIPKRCLMVVITFIFDFMMARLQRMLTVGFVPRLYTL
jgi:hypothetical protein